MNLKKLFTTLISTVLVGTIALLALPMTAFATDKSAGPTWMYDSNDAFFIKNKNSGKYLDVSGGTAKNGANVIQWGFTGKKNQQWRLQRITNDTYKIVSELDYKYSIDIAGKSAKAGANAQLWKSSQTFWVNEFGTGTNSYHTFESTVSGSAKHTLGVSGSSKKDGANVNQGSFGNSKGDQWQLERVTFGTDGKPKYSAVNVDYRADYFYIKNKNSGKYLDIAGGKSGNGKNIIQANYSGKPSQRFRIWKLQNGNYSLLSMVDAPKQYGYMVDVAKSSTKEGANVQLWGRSSQEPENQQWNFKRQKDGSYKLYGIAGGKFLSVAGGSKQHGANVVQGTAGDVWVLETMKAERPKDNDPYKYYPESRKVEDIDMKALIAYGIKYGESIGMKYDPTITDGYGSWDTPIIIGRRFANDVTEAAIRGRLDAYKRDQKADTFGFWYKKGKYWRSDGRVDENMDLYVGYGGGPQDDGNPSYD